MNISCSFWDFICPTYLLLTIFPRIKVNQNSSKTVPLNKTSQSKLHKQWTIVDAVLYHSDSLAVWKHFFPTAAGSVRCCGLQLSPSHKFPWGGRSYLVQGYPTNDSQQPIMINVEAQSLGPEMSRDPRASLKVIWTVRISFFGLGVQHKVQSYKEVDWHIILFVDEASYFMFYFILLNFIFQCPCSVHLGENVTCYTVPLIVKIE